MTARPIEAAIFDMDGLLIDTERALFETMVEIGPEFGVSVDRPLFQSLIGLHAGASDELMMQAFGSGFPMPDFRNAVRTRFRSVNAAGVCLKAGVVELLDHLDAQNLPRAVCTSSGHEQVEHHLGRHGILPRFTAIVAHGDYENGKPHPDPFLTAAARLGVDPAACIAFEDSHNGVRAAHAAGMQVVMVPDMLDATEEMQRKCAHILGTLHEAQALFSRRDHG